MTDNSQQGLPNKKVFTVLLFTYVSVL